MALSREDKHDVKSAMGKAIANKVAKATKDYKVSSRNPKTGNLNYIGVHRDKKTATAKMDYLKKRGDSDVRFH